MSSHLILVAISMLAIVSGQLETVYQWRYLDYVWPSEAKKQEAIQKKTYIPSNLVPIDVDISKDGRVFITVTGSLGVPARLGTVSHLMSSSGPLIQPYPNWNWTDQNDCDSIIRVDRITVDNCNRLWVMDNAVQNGSSGLHCRPKLLAFDLWTDTLLTKVLIPEGIATNAKTNQSLFLNVKVETQGQYCENTTVYMADSLGNGLVILDSDQLYRIEGSAFNPDPKSSNVTIGNNTAQIPFGIVGMDLSPKIFHNESSRLYFRPIASHDLFHAETSSLKSSAYGESAKIEGTKNILSSQSIGHAFSSEGTLFFGKTTETAIACWNRYRELKRANIEIVAQDEGRLHFSSGIKVVSGENFSEEELWVITNGFVQNSRHDLDTKKINFRIWRSSVESLIAGTKCEMPKHLKESLTKTKLNSRKN